ncbi:MAG: AbrB/MazE/SpoVT family DNA-binding domain-containing protein [Chloroflexota bacterium]
MLTVRVGPDGRILVPVELRRELGLQPGMPLVARVEDDRLVLERRETVLRRLQSLFGAIPEGVSLADELVAERRREAEREAE